MNSQRKTSINIAISILKRLIEGKRIEIGDETVAASDDGCLGYVWELHNEEMVIGNLTIRELAELVEKYEIVPIPEVGI